MGREYFEDYAVGEIMVSPSRTITETDIINFAMMTGDWHPIHVDQEYAKTSVFGERIAHGMLTLTLGGSLSMWMGPHVFVPRSFVAFLGMEMIQVTAPTRINDTLHWEGTVTAMEPKSKGRGVITYSCEIYNQEQELCARYVQKVLVGCRPGPEAPSDGGQAGNGGR